MIKSKPILFRAILFWAFLYGALSLALLLAGADLALANPIPPSALNPESPVMYIAAFLILAGESYLVARLLERYGLSRKRLWVAGLGMNLMTWSIGMSIMANSDLTRGYEITQLLLFIELGIVIVEAALIMAIARWSWVQLEEVSLKEVPPKEAKPVGLLPALAFSLIGNIASWGIGLATLWLSA